MYCPECGREIKEQSNFCPECGFHLENILPYVSDKGQSKSKTYDVMTIRQTYKNAYEKWTEAEDKELTSEFLQGLTVSQLAEKHQRKKGAISSRLVKLHLTK
jgi:hypothetical protein